MYKLSAERLPAIRRECTDKATRKEIRKLEKEIEKDLHELIDFSDHRARSDVGNRMLPLIVENPGITYTELADKLGINKKAISRAAGELDGVVRKPREDLPKIFGNHPTGLWIAESE